MQGHLQVIKSHDSFIFSGLNTIYKSGSKRALSILSKLISTEVDLMSIITKLPLVPTKLPLKFFLPPSKPCAFILTFSPLKRSKSFKFFITLSTPGEETSSLS